MLFIGFAQAVVARVAAGQSRRSAAEDLEVSPFFSVKLVARHYRTGSFAPGRQGGPPGSGKLAPYREFPGRAREAEASAIGFGFSHFCRLCSMPEQTIPR